MKRRDLFKMVGGFLAGAVAAPLAKLIPERQPHRYWEGTNIPMDAFKEVADLEKRVQAVSGAYQYTFAYLDKHGNILQPNIHVYREET